MKRRFWTVVLSLVAVLCLTFALTACGGGKTECEKGNHEFETAWTPDATYHWHKCKNCDEIADKAAHVYDNNEDVTCNLCGYERTVAPSVKAYTISFETNGGSSIKSIQAEAGEEISAPVAPTKSGERFIGWYESTDGGTTLNTTAFVFGYMPGKNITLYAKWQDAVIGSWETYQVVMPAETEGDDDIVVNLGEEFPFLGTTLSKNLFILTVEDTSLSLTMTVGETSETDSATYKKTADTYTATLTIMKSTVYTLTTYDETNDRLVCEIRDKDGENYTTYYRLTLTRVNG